jgi:hypothetical protein
MAEKTRTTRAGRMGECIKRGFLTAVKVQVQAKLHARNDRDKPGEEKQNAESLFIG